MASPLISYYDDRAGERAAVSAGGLGDWAGATAALLVEECGLGAGDRVAVLLPPHWQTAAVLLGAWSAGLEVSYQGWSTAGLQPAGSFDATFVAGSRVGSWLEDLPSGRHQFVLGATADGYRQFTEAVRPYLGKRPAPALPGDDRAATTEGATFGALGAIAQSVAESKGIGRGDRVLIDAATSEQPVIWLLAPLLAGASIVLCANLDHSILDARVTEEHVTKVL
jgi:uncharacterized protein (TIGR03089 family)